VHSSFFSRFAAVLTVSAATAGCAVEGPPAPDLHDREVRFTLLHTADWHSRLFPYNQTVSVTDQALGLDQSKAPFGGAARMNWLIQRERAHADRVLHLDSGDCFQGAPIFNFFSGEAETRALAHTGVDGVVIGNHEFDRGAGNLVTQYSRWATFPVLAANYQLDDPTTPGSAGLSRITRPYHIYDVRGLKVGVIGFGNLSSITSVFDQPNRAGITPLNTTEVAQFYIDMLRAQNVDLIVGVSHLGLDDDVHTINRTSGLDVMLGGHLHIVLNPSQVAIDCLPEDADGNHFIPVLDCATDQRGCTQTACNAAAGDCCDASGVCPPEGSAGGRAWRLRPGYRARACHPRPVVLQHSGAFMKYLGRLDLVLTDYPERISQVEIGDAAVGEYDPQDRFEVVGHRFTLFPVDSSVPEEPTMARLLEPYALALDRIANLDNLIGYSPNGVSRTNTNGGDSPMGNLVTTAMQRRLGIQTDFALTNTLGIRDAIPTGPVTVDQIFNVFPFDNSITTIQLSGREVLELFDFVARRSSGRGCNSQAQISGARVAIQCGGCDRDGVPGPDSDSEGPLTACAQSVNIGLRADVISDDSLGHCNNDNDCNPDPNVPPLQRSLCKPDIHRCMSPLALNASYSLAANDYIAAGGSGFFVLQRNTTQVNTYVQLRDALVDYVQNGNPCGYNAAIADAYRSSHPGQAQHGDDGLAICQTDADCGDTSVFQCSCQDRIQFDSQSLMCPDSQHAPACMGENGRCVLRQCATDVSNLVAQRCPTGARADDPGASERCRCAAAQRAGESCRILACFDESVGAIADGRLHMETYQ
jgi:5'-nucleotidase